MFLVSFSFFLQSLQVSHCTLHYQFYFEEPPHLKQALPDIAKDYILIWKSLFIMWQIYKVIGNMLVLGLFVCFAIFICQIPFFFWADTACSHFKISVLHQVAPTEF
ncbi:Hypothetical predicted protein [Podarcis lilfordi]|uniref:Uncharacterized protein n=1 Tax=Podarcis lilfordi TaxID=74358 RepID=A0AA35JUQ9_9SAUR|nr:Hypothetical predicted protein [Podarcis lilfordi]